ncbi:MAG: alpha/beta hydrolase [Desulfobacteraceae bacterium]|nr:MAG: alpha/beta hydrolase [Desulfobacteraceae bacterium]
MKTVTGKMAITIISLSMFCFLISCSKSSTIYAPLVYDPAKDSIRVFYTAEGKKDPTILFVHGWSCDHTFWDAQVRYFKNNYRVVTIDLPGHGESSAPEIPYTINLFAESIKSVLDELNIDKAFLVGHSMGYPVARRFIQQYPDRASGFCIVDGAYFRVPEDEEEIIEWEQQNSHFLQGFREENRAEFIRQFIDSLFVKQSSPVLKKSITRRIMNTPAHVANSAMEDMVRKENWEEYPLHLPTLAVYAASPDMPQDNEAYLQTLFTDLEYHEWTGVGHFIMMEQPDRFNSLLSGYLMQRFNQPLK